MKEVKFLFLNYDKDIFVVFFHHIVFAGKFFLRFGAVGQFLILLFDLGDLAFIVTGLFLQCDQFLTSVVLHQHVILIKKKHPYSKCYSCQKEEISENGRKIEQEGFDLLHGFDVSKLLNESEISQRLIALLCEFVHFERRDGIK